MRASSMQAGYTLIEVLVAFVILALALTVLLRIFSGGLRSVDVASDYTRAVLIAETELAAAGIGAPLRPGNASGATDDGFRWTRSVRPYSPSGEQAPIPAYLVSVNVEWPAPGTVRHVELTTVRLAAVGERR